MNRCLSLDRCLKKLQVLNQITDKQVLSMNTQGEYYLHVAHSRMELLQRKLTTGYDRKTVLADLQQTIQETNQLSELFFDSLLAPYYVEANRDYLRYKSPSTEAPPPSPPMPPTPSAGAPGPVADMKAVDVKVAPSTYNIQAMETVNSRLMMFMQIRKLFLQLPPQILRLKASYDDQDLSYAMDITSLAGGVEAYNSVIKHKMDILRSQNYHLPTITLLSPPDQPPNQGRD